MTTDPSPAPPQSKTPLVAGLVVLALVIAGLGYYFGVHRPEQARRAAAQELQAQEQAGHEALGWVGALPLTAPDSDIAAVAAKIGLYASSAPAARAVEARAALDQRRALILAERERVRLANARGGLIVTTTPPGADVAVGGIAAEKSPVALKDVKLGKYPVIVRLAGYEDRQLEAEVKENQIATLDVTLVRATGGALIDSNPPGLAVDVGSPMPDATRQTVTTPAKLEKLPAGVYVLTFHRDGWPDRMQTMTVQRNQTVSAQAEFVGGGLEIASTPAGAEVWALGRQIGRAPLKFADLAPGAFDLEFRLAGYRKAHVQGEVKARETAVSAVTLEKIPGPEPGKAWSIPDLKLDLVPIAPGTFTMGSPAEEDGRTDNEGPQMQVTLTRPYWLGRTEVTQAQYLAVMGTNPSRFQGEDLPVEEVTWDQAMEFCRKLTEREIGAGNLPEGCAYTLPTEAQWEYACRAGTTGPFGGDGKMDDMGWFERNSANATHPVGQKQANAWGLTDMHGNVWEWCLDAYGLYPGGSVTDYRGPAFGNTHVIRGGAWYSPARLCRSAHRNAGTPDANYFLGFRLALTSAR